jgi:CarboxypepD_reg-like domain
MKKRITIIFATLISLSVNCIGQIIISGKILELNSSQPSIGASIQIENTDIRTISNEEGGFEIKTSTLPITLIVSYVGYKKERMYISKADFVTIKLSQETVELAEVRVGNSALVILNAMIQKELLSTSKKQLYRAFYRRISSNNGVVSRFQEMFTNVSWNLEGISEWQPINIRYAEVNPLWSSNSYILTFIHTAIVHKYEGFPINSLDLGKQYQFKIKTYTNIGTDNETAIITYKSLDSKRTGEIYVNTKNDNLLKITGINKAVLHGKFKKTYSFEANFREKNKGQTVFDNIFVTETTGRTLDLRKAKERLWLYFEKEITDFDKEKPIYPAFLKSDRKILLSVPYSTNYWLENVPFSATENIKKIIEKMEQSDKFTSNFN